ncbi:hypothetical protein ACFVYG_29035 [Streptomyces sp. NPDC058256]|uniref:hypothetical protein n=1 Tax=Streptomyces sp. NPDC058256 TaxID=3346408 RepID=UPI0036EB9161
MITVGVRRIAVMSECGPSALDRGDHALDIVVSHAEVGLSRPPLRLPIASMRWGRMDLAEDLAAHVHRAATARR